MKQLINKHDKNVRLVGLTEAEQREDYIYFEMPTHFGAKGCVWSIQDWFVADIEEDKGECPELLDWIKERIKAKRYSVAGVSKACGYSPNWLPIILAGKRRIRAKNELILEEALGLKKGAIARKRREILHKDSDV